MKNLYNKNLMDFLSIKDIKNNNIFKEMNCNEIEFELMRYMTISYLREGKVGFNFKFILEGFIDSLIMNENNDLLKNFLNKNNKKNKKIIEENYHTTFEEFEYIQFIPNIKNLIKLGWINLFDYDIEENDINFLNNSLDIEEIFFHLLQDGELKEIEFESIKIPYRNYDEFMSENFKYIEALFSLNKMKKNGIDIKNSPIFKIKENYLKKLDKQITLRSKKNKFDNKYLNFIDDANLTEKENKMLLYLFKNEFDNSDDGLSNDVESDMASIISLEKNSVIEFRKFIFASNLFMEGHLIIEKSIHPLTGSFFFYYFLSEELLNKLNFETPLASDVNTNHERKNKKKLELFEQTVKTSPIFEILEDKILLKDVVLNDETSSTLKSILKQTNKEVSQRLASWGIKKESTDIDSKIIFHGKPGTGKTMTAIAFSNELGKKIISFDCSKLLSQYVGESEKNVREIFDTYNKIVKETDVKPVLLLNEADQFLGSRIENPSSGSDTMHNQMQNIFLEQIERFDGILIATTNLLTNIDVAFSRRFNQKIEIKPPNFEQRVKIWKLNLPKNAEYEKNFDIKKISQKELTGAQIELVIKNTSYKVAVREEDFVFKIEDFLKEINAEKSTSFDNEGNTMGFVN